MCNDDRPVSPEGVAGWKRLVQETESARHPQVHPSTLAFCSALEEIKRLHVSKSQDYGSESDPLANIRNGAAFVGIEPWRGAMVRLSDKVTRLATFNRTGRLAHEGVEDTLLDLAAYSLLALVLYRESRHERTE